MSKNFYGCGSEDSVYVILSVYIPRTKILILLAKSEDVFAITSMACLSVKIWFGFSIWSKASVRSSSPLDIYVKAKCS